MKLIWNDDSFLKNGENTGYQLDSSRTTDSISNIYTNEEKSKYDEKIISNFSSLNHKNKEINDNEDNISKRLLDEKTQNSNGIISFKKGLSFTLSSIYLILFLTNIPKIPVKIGEEGKIEFLLQNSKNEHINILINNFSFFCTKSVLTNNNCEIKGNLLEFKNNNIFILRWFIGFFYFILIVKNIMILIQKISMLFFPLFLFYFDLHNKISYTEILNEQINNKSVSFIMMKEKKFSNIDYIEGLIPSLFSFLISIDYTYLENFINNLFIKKKKLNKLV